MTSDGPDNMLDPLRDEFPSWDIGSIWNSSNSGPDTRIFYARFGMQRLASLSIPGLRDLLVKETANPGSTQSADQVFMPGAYAHGAWFPAKERQDNGR